MARKTSPPSKSTSSASAAKPKGAVARSAAKALTKKAAAAPPATKKPTAVKSSSAKAVAAKPAATKKGPIALRTAAPPKTAIEEPEKYYVVAERQDLRISKQKPTSNSHIAAVETYGEAKDKAVDYLIALIDTYERRLWELKRSTDLDA